MFLIDYLVEYNRYMQILGIGVLLCIAFIMSDNRRSINLRLIGTAGILHILFAWFMLKTSIGCGMMRAGAHLIERLYQAADSGIQFLFGSLGIAQDPWGFIFAFKVLPVIVFFGALMALLFHLGIIQFCVGIIARVMRPILGTSGAETLCAIANSFLGQTEAPLVIKNYLPRMTRSEVFLIMVGGMGHISGSILAVYARIGVPAEHLLSASLMALPATIIIAKMLVPETEQPETSGNVMPTIERSTSNALEAISVGTSDGLHLALNIGAMLIAFIALIGTINMLLCWMVGQSNALFDINIPCVSLESIFGLLFAPIGWLLGLVDAEALMAGKLIGLKVAVNEMIAYTKMVVTPLSERGVILLTYALCGFSNFSSIGIQIGGIGALAPTKRKLLSELGFKAVLGGVMVNLLSAMVAGLLI